MAASVVLVTGANRGIGYEIVKALVESELPYHVFLGARDVEKGKTAAASLKPRSGSSITVLELEVSSAESIAKAAATVKAETGRLDILVNNAGIVDENSDAVARLRNTLEINTIAPYAVSTAFKPLLLVQPETGTQQKRIVYVSSGLGSIVERLNSGGRYYSIPAAEYRMSKSALNMLAACDAFELKEHGVKVFAYDPEFVATSLTGSPEERRKMGALEPSVSGESCRDIIEGKRDADTQKFVSINGTDLAW
ncbi:hypothetical protein TARUN_7994 [Trichoderma arundinaceum]|uniref:Short-chain dehydrogenase n=1 Tax=Trichoderma arundinaceum TaxID=490622 RepID=A0A395NE73_TRIAR|nr:hypothetical protein TARUN_7994 [Trichoderma arundinaceum]